MKTNKMQLIRDFSVTIVWACVAWAIVEILAVFTGITREQGFIFFAGAGMMFVGLTLLGHWKLRNMELNKKAAMEQFIADQKADQEKQAKIDREIIEQLRNEHQLSGTEQDRRLRALETAIKHLRGR